MNTQRVIPRFLLPQTSWNARMPRHTAIRSLPPNLNPLHHPLSTSTRPSQAAMHVSVMPRGCHQQLTRGATAVTAAHAAKQFSTSRNLHRDHHFDTLKFVQRLRDEGFSEEQSKAMMLVLSDVIEESIQNLTRTMVLKEGKSCSSTNLLCFQMQIGDIRTITDAPWTMKIRCGPLHLHAKSRLHQAPLRAARP